MSNQSVSFALNSLHSGKVFIPRFKLTFVIDGKSYDVYANHLFKDSCKKLSFPNTLKGAICSLSPEEDLLHRADCTVFTSLDTKFPVQMITLISSSFATYLADFENNENKVIYLSAHPSSTRRAIILFDPIPVNAEILKDHDDSSSQSTSEHSEPNRKRSTTSSSTQTTPEDALEFDLTVANQFIIMLIRAIKDGHDSRRRRCSSTLSESIRNNALTTSTNPLGELHLAMRSGASFYACISIILGFHRQDERDATSQGELHKCLLGPCLINYLLVHGKCEPNDIKDLREFYKMFINHFINERFIRPLRPIQLLELAQLASRFRLSDALFECTDVDDFLPPGEGPYLDNAQLESPTEPE